MKHLKLLDAAYVAGVLRYPADGVVSADDGEAQRLIDANLAEDVSADFPDDLPPPAPAPATKE